MIFLTERRAPMLALSSNAFGLKLKFIRISGALHHNVAKLCDTQRSNKKGNCKQLNANISIAKQMKERKCKD